MKTYPCRVLTKTTTIRQRRWLTDGWYFPKSRGDTPHEKVPKLAWESSIELPVTFGRMNDQGLEHFWVSKVMDRLPPNSEIPLPDTSKPLTLKLWKRFYNDMKAMHPMPVTQWYEEKGWLFTERNDPYLKEYRTATTNVYQTFSMNKAHAQETAERAIHGSRQALMAIREKLRLQYSPSPPCDVVLKWIVSNVSPGANVVEVQAKLGYWAAQLRQMNVPVVAYEVWNIPYTRRGHKPFTEVIEDSGEKQFANGVHDKDTILAVFPDRELTELDNWNGDTVILVGTGAIGGSCDVGRYLINRNEGWYLHSHHRVLIYPLFYEHAYCFKRLKEDNETKDN